MASITFTEDKVAGALKTNAAHGVLAAATSIYDRTQQSFQSDINADILRRVKALEESMKTVAYVEPTLYEQLTEALKNAEVFYGGVEDRSYYADTDGIQTFISGDNTYTGQPVARGKLDGDVTVALYLGDDVISAQQLEDTWDEIENANDLLIVSPE